MKTTMSWVTYPIRRRHDSESVSAQVPAVEKDPARRGRAQAAQEVDQRRLAGARSADDGHHLAASDGQVDVLEYLIVYSREAVRHVFEPDAVLETGEGRGTGRRLGSIPVLFGDDRIDQVHRWQIHHIGLIFLLALG